MRHSIFLSLGRNFFPSRNIQLLVFLRKTANNLASSTPNDEMINTIKILFPFAFWSQRVTERFWQRFGSMSFSCSISFLHPGEKWIREKGALRKNNAHLLALVSHTREREETKREKRDINAKITSLPPLQKQNPSTINQFSKTSQAWREIASFLFAPVSEKPR